MARSLCVPAALPPDQSTQFQQVSHRPFLESLAWPLLVGPDEPARPRRPTPLGEVDTMKELGTVVTLALLAGMAAVVCIPILLS
jgi:hypothetical protein